MQRERLTRTSQAAFLVGWISTTDAMFVGLILTLAVTLFVASRLQDSEGKARQMQDTVDALQGQLGQVETERDRLRQENSRLDAVAVQLTPLRTDVETARGRLRELQARAASLEGERDRLQQENRRLDALTAQLEAERDKWKAYTRKVDQEKKRLSAENETLKGKVDAAVTQLLDTRKALEQIATERRDVQTRIIAANEARDAALRESTELRTRIEAEPGLHKELLGLKGRLNRVAIIFDRSGSMAQSGRWEHARGVVATWLEHLAIREAVLIVFSTEAEIYPEDGNFLDLRGPEGAANRRLLLERIGSAKPEGGTNTLRALQLAYRCPNLGSILLFTDGEPNDPRKPVASPFDPEAAEEIYALCRQHKDVPVNTIGLGNYFKPELSGFLMRVAQETGGSFQGR